MNIIYIVVGSITLKFWSTGIQASLKTKVSANPTCTRDRRQPQILSLLGLSHAFGITSIYFKVLGRCSG